MENFSCLLESRYLRHSAQALEHAQERQKHFYCQRQKRLPAFVPDVRSIGPQIWVVLLFLMKNVHDPFEQAVEPIDVRFADEKALGTEHEFWRIERTVLNYGIRQVLVQS